MKFTFGLTLLALAVLTNEICAQEVGGHGIGDSHEGHHGEHGGHEGHDGEHGGHDGHHGEHGEHHGEDNGHESNSGGISPPNPMDKAATARWIAHNTAWCSLSTIDSRDRKGAPFGNIASFSDGAKDGSTGSIYMLHSALDATIIDVMSGSLISFSVSEMQTGYCQGKGYDAEDPRCARLSIGGRLVEVPGDEIETAKTALFDKHPGMEDWYDDDEEGGHDFKFWKIDMEEIWLVDFFGGPAHIGMDAWNRGTDKEGDSLNPAAMSVPHGQEQNLVGFAGGNGGSQSSFPWSAVVAVVAMGLGFFVGRRSTSADRVALPQYSDVPPNENNPVA